MNKVILYTLIGLVVLGALLTVGQIWGLMTDWVTYGKIIATLVVLILVLAFVLVVKLDFGERKKMKDENYLD